MKWTQFLQKQLLKWMRQKHPEYFPETVELVIKHQQLINLTIDYERYEEKLDSLQQELDDLNTQVNCLRDLCEGWKEEVGKLQIEKEERRSKLLGYSTLESDRITGERHWVSYDKSGEDRVSFGLGQALSLPVDKFEIETKIEMYEK